MLYHLVKCYQLCDMKEGKKCMIVKLSKLKLVKTLFYLAVSAPSNMSSQAIKVRLA